ncbi:MAG: LUD domain-containing protein [Azospirillaceae bacterium]
MSARDQILSGIARARGSAADRAAVEERIARHQRNLIPSRADLPPAERVALFAHMALENAATVAEVATPADVPPAVRDFLAGHNLPARVKLAPDPSITGIDWSVVPTLETATGRAADADVTSVTAAMAGIAETGTLMLAGGPDSPTTLNFLPDNHIVVLRRDQVLGNYEEAWDLIRARFGEGAMPRTVNMVTGPSRTGDIEQTIQLGAHGPRRLHIILVGGDGGP